MSVEYIYTFHGDSDHKYIWEHIEEGRSYRLYIAKTRVPLPIPQNIKVVFNIESQRVHTGYSLKDPLVYYINKYMAGEKYIASNKRDSPIPVVYMPRSFFEQTRTQDNRPRQIQIIVYWNDE